MKAVAGNSSGTDPVAVVVTLSRALQAAGVPAGAARAAEAVRALQALDPARLSDVYWAGRLTMCGDPEDLPRYDRVFAAVFAGDLPRTRPPPRRDLAAVSLADPDPGERPDAHPDDGAVGDEEMRVLRSAASRVEILRHRDVSTLSANERRRINDALAALTLPGPARPSRRFEPAVSGSIDPRRTTRAVLRDGGEVRALHRHRHATRPRRVVVLADISGSMAPYADTLLRFGHAAGRRRGVSTEVFTIGTRLTRVTREMSTPDAGTALAAVAAAVPDWSGGTRLGDLLRQFLDDWGQRGVARGAVVAVLSDGWERGDATLLGEQMARLQRLAHRVVWANPRKAVPGYEPVAAGMAAALPYVDDFVEGHSLAALERLAQVLAGAPAGGPPRA